MSGSWPRRPAGEARPAPLGRAPARASAPISGPADPSVHRWTAGSGLIPARYRCWMAQRRGIAFFRPEVRSATATGTQMRGAAAIGALAVGAAAVGGFAIGRLSVGRLSIGRAAIDELKIGELEVERLRLPDGTPPAG